MSKTAHPEHKNTKDVLVVVADSRVESEELGRLRSLAEGGARIVAWQHTLIAQDRFPSPDVEAFLKSQGIPAVSLSNALGYDADIEVDERVIAWFKELGRAPLGPGVSFRDLYRYQGMSLWWWAELWLYHDTPLRIVVRDIEALKYLLEKERPRRLVLVAPVRRLAEAATRLAGEVEVRGEAVPLPSIHLKTSIRFWTGLLKMLGSGLKAVINPTPREPWQGCPRFFFLSHASMWRRRRIEDTGTERFVDIYFDELPQKLVSDGDGVKMVAVGPRVPFRERRAGDVLKDAVEIGGDREGRFVPIRNYFSLGLSLRLAADACLCWRMWRDFRLRPGLEEASSHCGVRLDKEALSAFRESFLFQLPWVIRSFHELTSALRVEKPDLLVLYAEYTALGRTAVAAASAAGVPSFALQHGILYPRLYANEHEQDEVTPAADGCDGVPLPTCTAVFGSLARELLTRRGHYPPERIVITGSPKFDALLRAESRYDLDATRERLGIGSRGKMLVVASRWTAIGPVFADLVRACESVPDLTLVVKPHQAEGGATYQEVADSCGAVRLRIVPPEENLFELLYASDGLVTVDSFASSEALVLGKPVLVVNLPSNLGPLVKRGVALGVYRGESIESQVRKMLLEEEHAREFEQKRREYLMEFAFGADGLSTTRIVTALREVAERGK
jgi:hypothetical protein